MPSPSITDKPAATQRRLWLATLASAVLATLAFPPADLGFLAWVALVPLAWALLSARRARQAFALAYVFGFVHWGWIITWIGATVVAWAHTPLGWIAWFLLTAIKALWFGLFGALAWWVGRRTQGAARALAIAAAWTLVEWLRGQYSLAMPWSLLGYSQYRYLPLIQVADLAGVYGVSFVLVAFNAAIVEALEAEGKRAKRRALALPAALLAATLAYGALALGRAYGGTPVQLALMQPDIASLSSDGESATGQMERYRELASSLTPQSGATGPLLVVWPEGASPGDAAADPMAQQEFANLPNLAGAYQVIGTGHEDAMGRPYNSAALLGPGGAYVDRYDKRWLVPYGEWMPGRAWMPFGNIFHYIEQDTVAGAGNHLLSAGPLRLSVLICYESVFPVLARTDVARGANLLVSITNHSWAGPSAQLRQHIAMAALRAVETRRYLAASATTGITCLIAPDGQITPTTPYRPEAFRCQARLREGLTPYARFGDWFVGLCAIGLAATLSAGRFRRAGNMAMASGVNSR